MGASVAALTRSGKDPSGDVRKTKGNVLVSVRRARVSLRRTGNQFCPPGQEHFDRPGFDGIF